MGKNPTPEQLAKQAVALKKLKDGCNKAKQGPVSFFFCVEGPEGEPVLLVGKRIQAQSKSIVAKAKIKKFVRGKLVYEGGKFTFQADKASSKFKQMLKNRFGKEHPPLKSAAIVMLDDGAAETTMKEELTAEVERRAARRSGKEAEEAGDTDGYWKAKHAEAESDLGAKLDVVSNAEQAIAARLARRSTEDVLPRLEKNQQRTERLIRAAKKLLREVRA
ncbi:MAG: hypothetical protein ACI8S6_005795 [Myxococcota bacterium]|jgi:hypothetical protein